MLKVYICTFGCQMNEYDSEVAGGILKAAGFEVTAGGGHPEEARKADEACLPARQGSQDGDPSQPSAAQDDRRNGLPQHDERNRIRNDGGGADIVLLNTCSVREHAEDRVYGRLGMLGKAKKENPDLIVGLMGCMVEEHREKLFQRFPQLDLMVGTRNIKELPSLIEEVRRTRQQVSRIKQNGISIEYTDLVQRHSKFHAWLPIMTGCNKVCTFCIVPITRGPEVSMPAREIYREASRLVGEGVKWITLLGQNVNSYRGYVRHPEAALSVRHSEPLKGAKNPRDPSQPLAAQDDRRNEPPQDDGDIRFPQLLEKLCQIDGLERISFTTSHPSDATEELFQVIAQNPKISRRFHLPLQSGSDRILKRMKRLHTYEDYKRKIERLRELVPDIALTTDLIAGFSGETDEDHQATMRALREIRFEGAYIFKYSVRPATPAAKLPDDVPQEVKERRNRDLLDLQRQIATEKNREWVGCTVEVFVEDRSTKHADQLLGRTLQEKKAVFDAPPELIGTFQAVKLLDVKNETFQGVVKDNF